MKIEQFIFYLLTIPVIAVCSVMISIQSSNKQIKKRIKYVKYEKKHNSNAHQDCHLSYKRVWVPVDN